MVIKLWLVRATVALLGVWYFTLLSCQAQTSGGAIGGNGTTSPNSNIKLRGLEYSLQTCFNRVLLNNPRTAAARANLKIAKSEYARATELPNPGIVLDNGFIATQEYTLGGLIPVGGPWVMAFQLLAAKKVVKEADLKIQRTLWLIRQQTRRQYVELLMAQERAQTAKELKSLFHKVLDASKKRLQAGDVPKLDVLRAELAYLQSSIDLAKDTQQVERAKQQLNILMAQSPHIQVATPGLHVFKLRAQKTDILPNFKKAVPRLEHFINLAMRNRLELKIVKQQVAVNKSKLTASISKNFPKGFLSFGRSINGNPPTGPKLRGYFMAAEIQLPVFNVQQGDISLYRATIRQLRQEQLAQRNIITAEVSDAYQRLLAAQKQVKIYQQIALDVSKEVVDLAQLGYDVGQLDLNSVLLVQQANVQVRNKYLDAVSQYQQAFADLEQAVNIPLD